MRSYYYKMFYPGCGPSIFSRNKFVPKEEGGGGGGNVTVTKKGREGGGALNVRLSPPLTPNVDSNSKSNIVG